MIYVPEVLLLDFLEINYITFYITDKKKTNAQRPCPPNITAS